MGDIKLMRIYGKNLHMWLKKMESICVERQPEANM